MCNSLNIKPKEGGGYRPPADVILIKVREYRRRKHLNPIHITITDRRIIAYTLYQHFGFQDRQIAEAYNVTVRTIQRDIKLMEFHVKQYKHLADKVKDLYDYIIYNAKYIH